MSEIKQEVGSAAGATGNENNAAGSVDMPPRAADSQAPRGEEERSSDREEKYAASSASLIPPSLASLSGDARPRGGAEQSSAAASAVNHMAKKYAAEALAVLASIMNDAEEKGPARLAAANALLDRGYGRPVQMADSEPAGSAPLLISIVGVQPAAGKDEAGRNEVPTGKENNEAENADMPPRAAGSQAQGASGGACPRGGAAELLP